MAASAGGPLASCRALGAALLIVSALLLGVCVVRQPSLVRPHAQALATLQQGPACPPAPDCAPHPGCASDSAQKQGVKGQQQQQEQLGAAAGASGGAYPPDALARLAADEPLLQPRALKRGLYSMGELHRLRRFMHKLLSGAARGVVE